MNKKAMVVFLDLNLGIFFGATMVLSMFLCWEIEMYEIVHEFLKWDSRH